MNIPKATASCNDCHGKTTFTNDVSVVPSDFFLKSPLMGHLNGFNLIAACSDHHAGFKDPDDNGKPQHRSFTLFNETGRQLGHFGVTSQGMSDVGLWIDSNELRTKLTDEALAGHGPERM